MSSVLTTILMAHGGTSWSLYLSSQNTNAVSYLGRLVGYVPNPSQGFMGLWWNFRKWRGCNMYWQIEQGKLCLKIGDVKEEERRRLRGECWSVVSRHAKERGLSEVVKRPGRFGLGASMTVAVVERQDWLGADDAMVDAEAVVGRLKEYGRFLDECVK